MRDLPQSEHCDLGLVDFDLTEDLRPIKNAPDQRWSAAGGGGTTHQEIERKF